MLNSHYVSAMLGKETILVNSWGEGVGHGKKRGLFSEKSYSSNTGLSNRRVNCYALKRLPRWTSDWR